MTSEARTGLVRARQLTALAASPMKLLAGAVTLALLVSSAWGQTATLHDAARQGDVAAIEALVEDGADVNAFAYTEDDSQDLSTPLAVAARYGQVAAIEVLLALGAHPREGTQSDWKWHHWAPLHWAVYERHVEAVKALLAAAPGTVHAFSFVGDTPLCHAAAYGDEEITGMLLDAGASTNDPCGGSNDDTPLHLAVGSGDVATVKLLLAAGADVNATGRGKSSLHWATWSKEDKEDVALIELLLDAGAHIDAKITDGAVGYFGSTPLHNAAWFNQAAVEMLLARGADPNAEDHAGATPMHWAAGEGQAAAIEALLAAGAKAEARDEENRTPLHPAAEGGHSAAVVALIDAGADPNALDGDGRSPLDHAVAAGHAEAAEILRRAGRR